MGFCWYPCYALEYSCATCHYLKKALKMFSFSWQNSVISNKHLACCTSKFYNLNEQTAVTSDRCEIKIMSLYFNIVGNMYRAV